MESEIDLIAGAVYFDEQVQKGAVIVVAVAGETVEVVNIGCHHRAVKYANQKRDNDGFM
jgi:hypothetical protein